MKSHFDRCKMSITGKSTLPFITREMNRLKIVKNIELKKNKSMNNISNKQMEGLKFRELKRKRFCKILADYYNRIR